jgi:hypothetical protein
MSFKETFEKVECSEIFNKFKGEYPEAKFCAGFFIIDFMSNDQKKSLDYLIGDKIFTFSLFEDGIKMNEDKLMDIPNTPKLVPIDPKVQIEVEELKGIVGERALEEGISSKFHKIIAILQNYEDKEIGERRNIWNLTCMLDQLIILHVLIDAETGKLIKFERKSMTDLIKKKD